VLRLLAGASHKIWFRESGTVWACYAWWNPQRHKHVQFTTLPDGSLLPNDRGGRRTAVIDDVSAILRAHGVAVTSRGTPGRRSKLPLSEIVADVGRRRPTEDSFEAVFKAVAAERDCEWDSVRRRYWVDGKDLREHPPQPAPEPLMDGPRGPELAGWISTWQADKAVTFEEAAQEMKERRGWTPEQLRRQLCGDWEWDSTLTHTWDRTRGDWARMDDDEARATMWNPPPPLRTAAILHRLGDARHPGGPWTQPLRVSVAGGRLRCERISVLPSLSEMASLWGQEANSPGEGERRQD
jgi:hypothetical protein